MPKKESPSIPPELLSEYFRQLGAKGGRIGGKKTAAKLTAAQRKHKAEKAGKANLIKLTPAERRERAKRAAEARWQKERPD
jgi:hypothetical protein